MRETEKIWMNGELVDWADAKVHVGAHGLHYGSGVFEGIRCYETPSGPAIFRLRDHLQRLHNSASLIHMEIPFSVDDLHAAAHEVLGANGLPEAYLRPIAFYGYGELGDAGLVVTTSELNVSAFVPGLDQAEFDRRAHDAERNCPISNALRGAIEIRLNATLES